MYTVPCQERCKFVPRGVPPQRNGGRHVGFGRGEFARRSFTCGQYEYTSRDVVINDVALSSLKTPEWSQLVFCDVFVTILVWSLWWRHICSSVTKLVFSS
jgi:hypothetical protein